MELADLKKGSHIHLMGICGTAMASLAGLLKDQGFKVSGSDSNPYPPMSTQIEGLGIQIKTPYQASNLQPKPDFVIVGNVISKSNVEVTEMLRLNIPYTSLPKALGDLVIAHRESIVISGTHGKTTTTSLMSWVAQNVGVKPGFLIGGIPKNFGKSFETPQGHFFVIEGDEYDTAFFDKVPKFIHYKPRHVVLTSVEFDHADIYKDLNAVKGAFQTLMDLIPSEGHLVYWADDKTVNDLAKTSKAQKIGYGFKDGEFRPKVLKIDAQGTQFTVSYKGKSLGDFMTEMSGDYNILNITAGIAMAHTLGWDLEKVRRAIKSFEGVKRRQEILGEPKGILVIEDFAHHPTAVKETLLGLKAKYPKRKMFAVFEPRSATSRRKIFQKDYSLAFSQADETLLAQAFDQAKIDAENRFSSEELVQDLKAQGKNARVFTGADQIVSDLKSRAAKGDLIVIMSNGGFDGIYGKLMHALEQ